MMSYMVMAGTSDARRIIEELSTRNAKILATATTHHGSELARTSGADEVLTGRLDSLKLAEIINTHSIDVLIDATHPFASEATRNAVKAADTEGIRYIRFERPFSNIPDNDLLYKVNSFPEAVEEILKLTTIDDRIFHLAGVMTLPDLTEKIDPEQIVARILPSNFSIKKCKDLGVPARNIVAMEGIFSKEFNQALMKEYSISLVITKDSGEAGGTSSKIYAALELKIPVVMVVRPEVKELKGKLVLNNLEDVIRELK